MRHLEHRVGIWWIAWLGFALILGGGNLASAEEDGGSAPAVDQAQAEGIRLLDTEHLTVTAKNITQEDDGSSRFGIGLDYRYDFAWEMRTPIRSRLGLNGEGFLSLNDPNSRRSEADDASNFNAIINQLEYGAFEVFGDDPDVARRCKGPGLVSLTPDQRRDCARLSSLQTLDYTAVQISLQARSESSQTLRDTQVSIGSGVSLAPAHLTNLLFAPLAMLVPGASENGADIGQHVSPPLLFAGFDGVFAGEHRRKLDGANETFARARFEASWKTELFVPGLYPYVNYRIFAEVAPEKEIRRADKDFADFVEVGARYYVGEQDHAFVGVKYADGALPPYLERDSQISVGLGLTF